MDLLAEGLRQRAGIEWTLESLGKSGRVAVPLLIDLLRETDASLRNLAAVALSEMDETAAEAVPALRDRWRIRTRPSARTRNRAGQHRPVGQGRRSRPDRSPQGEVDLRRVRVGRIGPASQPGIPALLDALQDTRTPPVTVGTSPSTTRISERRSV